MSSARVRQEIFRRHQHLDGPGARAVAAEPWVDGVAIDPGFAEAIVELRRVSGAGESSSLALVDVLGVLGEYTALADHFGEAEHATLYRVVAASPDALPAAIDEAIGMAAIPVGGSSTRRELASLFRTRGSSSAVSEAAAFLCCPWLDDVPMSLVFANELKEWLKQGTVDLDDRDELAQRAESLLRLCEAHNQPMYLPAAGEIVGLLEAAASAPDDVPSELAQLLEWMPNFSPSGWNWGDDRTSSTEVARNASIPAIDAAAWWNVDALVTAQRQVDSCGPLTRAMIWLALVRPEASVRDLLSSEALSVAEQRGLGGRLADMRLVDVVGLGAAGAMAVDATPVIEVARDERTRQVLLERTFARGSDRRTLEDLGDELGLTRERIRQLERRAEQVLEGFLVQLRQVSPLVSSVLGARTQVESLATALPVLTGLDPSSVSGRIALAALSLTAYPHEAGGVLFSFDVDQAVARLAERAHREAQHHLLEESLIEEASALLGPAIDRLPWTPIGAGPFARRWVDRGTLHARAVAGLALIGGPATKQQISQAGNLPVARVSGVLSSRHEVVRADLDRWGFVEWVDDVYEGIAQEIVQRIEVAGGVARLEEVIADITAAFNVSAGSVRSYAMSDQFVVSNGTVRLAMEDEIRVSTDAEKVYGAIRTAHGWAQPVTVEQRHFEGFSLNINKKVAAANGIRPKDHLSVPVPGTTHEVSVIWRLTNLNGVDVGRVADPLRTVGAEAGDTIYVCPTKDFVRFDSEPAALPSDDAAHEPTGHLDWLDDNESLL